MCKLFKLLYRFIPLKRFRSFLIERHFSRCPGCQKELEIEGRLEEMLAVPDWIKEEKSLWPEIKLGLLAQREKNLPAERRARFFFHKKWQWAVAGLALAAAVGTNFLIHQRFLKKASEQGAFSEEKTRIAITFAEIKGGKARPYIYQTPAASFVWFAEVKNGGIK